jgi:CubicO group peptidase (beta-lactamase class C family)
VSKLLVEVEPAEVGLAEDRLSRIDEHFGRYVEDGRLRGWSLLLSRRGRIAHLAKRGLADAEAGREVEYDTLWRIFSMTKPITAVAAMSLYEEGLISLSDEVSRYIPAFADVRVWAGGSALAPRTVPATEPVRVWHLLSHTSGLTYGFMQQHPVDAMYRAVGSDLGQPARMDLAELCELWAAQPLLFQPGSEWAYSVSSDVLGRVVEVAAGKSLDQVFVERILEPLGMTETTWWVEGSDTDRLAALYTPVPKVGGTTRADGLGSAALRRPGHWSGGGGLISTLADYHRFTQMLLRGGELDGARVLSPRTLAYMARNHIPGGRDLAAFGRGQFGEAQYEGMGYGLGFGVVQDPILLKVPASPGEFNWGGAASTSFWVDPVEEITCIFMTQLLPSNTYPIRPHLRQLVMQSIVD